MVIPLHHLSFIHTMDITTIVNQQHQASQASSSMSRNVAISSGRGEKDQAQITTNRHFTWTSCIIAGVQLSCMFKPLKPPSTHYLVRSQSAAAYCSVLLGDPSPSPSRKSTGFHCTIELPSTPAWSSCCCANSTMECSNGDGGVYIFAVPNAGKVGQDAGSEPEARNGEGDSCGSVNAGGGMSGPEGLVDR